MLHKKNLQLFLFNLHFRILFLHVRITKEEVAASIPSSANMLSKDNDDGHCNRINLSLTAVHCYVVKNIVQSTG